MLQFYRALDELRLHMAAARSVLSLITSTGSTSIGNYSTPFLLLTLVDHLTSCWDFLLRILESLKKELPDAKIELLVVDLSSFSYVIFLCPVGLMNELKKINKFVHMYKSP